MQLICSSDSGVHRRAWLLGASYAAGMAVAILAAVGLRLGWRAGLDCLAAHHLTLSASWGGFVLVLGAAGLYDSDGVGRLSSALAPASVAVSSWTLLATVLLWATSSWDHAWGIPISLALLALVGVLAMRLAHRLTRGTAYMTSRCLVIGANDAARETIDLIHRHPEAGLRVVGVIHCGSEPGFVGTQLDGFPVLGTELSLRRLVRLHRIDRLIVAAPAEIATPFLRQLRAFRYHGLAVADYGSLHEQLTHEISVDHIDEQWLFAASMNSSRPHLRGWKRGLDAIASFAGLILAAPLAAAAALLVKLDSPGPVLYRQERLGRDGAAFVILKFRTMIADAESRTGPVWATIDDPRITRVGRWLRKFRIDELPQLINVLRGDMSLIGPRPERAVFVSRLTAQIPFYAERFMVRPGITGWAQVRQAYAGTAEASRRKLQADLYYIKHMSFLTDLHILLKTVRVVLLGRERNRPSQARKAAPRRGVGFHPMESDVSAL